MNQGILTVSIKQERDIVAVRRRVRQISALLGFSGQDNTRITTAVSEIARNAFEYAGGGKVEFIIEGKTIPQTFLIRVSDSGRGIENLTEILGGTYKSATGMGLGIIGSQRLMDDFRIESSAAGTVVSLRKTLPKASLLIDASRLRDIAGALFDEQRDDPVEEVQQQNQELLRTLAELRERQEDLLRLNRELEDTNRGVVALYAELDATAEDLRRADAAKTRFLSNMSHEFRTPLNSQLALTRLLLDRADGELSEEQEKQVRLIRRGAETLLELVNDLLDLAKIAAGKVSVRVEEFTVRDLFSTLRGMIRPLLASDSVQLIFEEPPAEIPPLKTDEGKVAQILRNFLSNALKFTTRGEVRVSARLSRDGQSVVFSVSDTGIGIAPEDRERIFEEFTQIDNSLQKSFQGTGLGLPLSRRLAELLGGGVTVESTLSAGTTFSAEIPCVFKSDAGGAEIPEPEIALAADVDSKIKKILIIDDDESSRYVLKRLLNAERVEFTEASSGAEGLARAREILPDLIFLDLEMPAMHGAEVLRELRKTVKTEAIPVVIVTSLDLEECRDLEQSALAILSKKNLTAQTLQEIFQLSEKL